MLGRLQDMLLEINNQGASLTTSQFTLAQLENALNQAQMDIVRDTGLINCHVGFAGDSYNGIGVVPQTELVPLPQDTMDIRRRAWISFDTNYPADVVAVEVLPPQDSWTLDAVTPNWESDTGTPTTSEEGLAPVPGLNLSLQPSDAGQLDLLYTPVPTALSNTGVPLSVPPDCAVAVMWRALYLLFSTQGEVADDQRARACNQQYGLLVGMVKSLMFMPNMASIQGAS